MTTAPNNSTPHRPKAPGTRSDEGSLVADDPLPPTELVRLLTRIEVKLDRAISDYEKHETRIAALEKRVWALPSAATVIALIGLVITLLRG